mmetsp:Transcript_73082/g.174126  ORF Transcript_73082/g.174126 Transcript_73082/m.174126 type:complete len:360 (-) Transcript_73082:107-1186(-)
MQRFIAQTVQLKRQLRKVFQKRAATPPDAPAQIPENSVAPGEAEGPPKQEEPPAPPGIPAESTGDAVVNAAPIDLTVPACQRDESGNSGFEDARSDADDQISPMRLYAPSQTFSQDGGSPLLGQHPLASPLLPRDVDKNSTLGKLLLECEEALIEKPLQKLEDIQSELEELLHADPELESPNVYIVPDGVQSMPLTRVPSSSLSDWHSEGHTPYTPGSTSASPSPWGMHQAWGISDLTSPTLGAMSSNLEVNKAHHRRSVPVAYEQQDGGLSQVNPFVVRPMYPSAHQPHQHPGRGGGFQERSLKRHRLSLTASRSEPVLPPIHVPTGGLTSGGKLQVHGRHMDVQASSGAGEHSGGRS